MMCEWWSNQLPIWRVILSCAAGLVWSIVIGDLVVRKFHEWQKSLLDPEPVTVPKVLPRTTGNVERFIFTLLAVAQPGAALAAMGGWLGLKMAAHWNKAVPPVDKDNAAREQMVRNSHAVLGLLSGLISMAFAASGGAFAQFLICL